MPIECRTVDHGVFPYFVEYLTLPPPPSVSKLDLDNKVLLTKDIVISQPCELY
jgi:hypothetical protein